MLYSNERIGSNITIAETLQFWNMVTYCELTDMKAQGAFFTWNNKRECEVRIYSKIDRVLINTEWTDTWENSVANYMPEGLFDHTPCVVYRKEEHTRRKYSFKFFNMWCKAPQFLSLVEEQWQQGVSGKAMYRLCLKLKALKKGLRGLNRDLYQDIENSAEVAKCYLINLQTQLQAKPYDKELMTLERVAAQSYVLLYEACQSYVKQKAKADWLDNGDENTTYFHGTIKKRRMINKVIQIEGMDGVFHKDIHSVHNAFVAYYMDLLGSTTETVPVHVETVRKGKV